MEVIFYCLYHEKLTPHVQIWTQGQLTRFGCLECMRAAWLAIVKLVGEDDAPESGVSRP